MPVEGPGVPTRATPVVETAGGQDPTFMGMSVITFMGTTLIGTPVRVGPTYPELGSPEVPAIEFERETEVVCARENAEEPYVELRDEFPTVVPYAVECTTEAVPCMVELLFIILFGFFFSVSTASRFLLGILAGGANEFRGRGCSRGARCGNVDRL